MLLLLLDTLPEDWAHCSNFNFYPHPAELYQPQHISESPDLNFQISSSCMHPMFYRPWSQLVRCFLTCPVSECPVLLMVMEVSLSACLCCPKVPDSCPDALSSELSESTPGLGVWARIYNPKHLGCGDERTKISRSPLQGKFEVSLG